MKLYDSKNLHKGVRDTVKIDQRFVLVSKLMTNMVAVTDK